MLINLSYIIKDSFFKGIILSIHKNNNKTYFFKKNHCAKGKMKKKKKLPAKCVYTDSTESCIERMVTYNA